MKEKSIRNFLQIWLLLGFRPGVIAPLFTPAVGIFKLVASPIAVIGCLLEEGNDYQQHHFCLRGWTNYDQLAGNLSLFF